MYNSVMCPKDSYGMVNSVDSDQALCLLNPICPSTFNINSLTTKRQTTKFSSANLQKVLTPTYIILRIQRLEGRHMRADSVDLDEMAYYEPPHQDLHCLQIQLFSSLVVKELTCI